MYKISFILFLNIHVKRHIFYSLIYDYFSCSKGYIDHQTLLEFGNKAGLTRKQTENEIIGCLYAPYLIKMAFRGTHYFITENAKLKFSDLITEGKYQLSDLGLSIQFEKKLDRLKIHLTDCLSNTFVENLLDRGWTRNKSLYRLMKKTKSFDLTIKEIGTLLNSLQVYDDNYRTFPELITNYGRYWSQLKTYTGNVFFKGHYKSKLIPLYQEFFHELLEKCKQRTTNNLLIGKENR